MHLKELQKEEQTKPKVSRKKEIIKIRAQIKGIENRSNRKINKIKNWFFENINKIGKSLARLRKKEMKLK